MSERSKAALDRIKRIIQQLQEKTESNGCTEAEAMAAAQKMGELLEQYNLSLDEVGLREDVGQCKENEVYAPDDYAGVLVVGIKHFCTLMCYKKPGDGHAGKYVFFGTPHDLEIALFLYEVCAEAMEHDWAMYMERAGYSMKKRMSFRAGFSNRVYERLMEMKKQRDAARASSCRDLIVLKDQLVTEEWAKRGIRLQKARGGSYAADGDAYLAGQRSGGRVNLNNPLGGGSGSHDQLR